MATKDDLISELSRMEELAENLGLIRLGDVLLIDDAHSPTQQPWAVHKLTGPVRASGDLHFLPGSGRDIGTTKKEALAVLKAVNATLGHLNEQER